jgi:hypothetical protein
MDMSGKISFSGEAGVRMQGHHLEQGYEFKAVRASLQKNRIDVSTPQRVEAYGNGKIEASQRLGISLAADILVGGIRPAAVNAFVGGEITGKLEGDLVYAIVPDNGWSGYGCIESRLWAGVQLDANFRIRAELPVDIYFKKFELAEVVEFAVTGQPIAFFDKDLGTACIVSGPFSLIAAVRGSDPKNLSNVLVDIDFSVAYNNTIVRSLTTKWLLVADCIDCTPLEFEISSNMDGLDTISLPTGNEYTLSLQAKNDLGIIIKQASTTLNVGDRPTASFAVATNDSNCANLKLTAIATAAGDRTITAYAWAVQRTGAGLQTYSGNPANAVVLPSCGETHITLTVTDSAGFVTSVSRTINTIALAPSVTSIAPTTATLNVATLFTVSGQNLPLTAVMSMADATCQTPTSRAATGFTVVCTPGGTAGSKVVTISTAAVGGTVIDASRTVTVTEVSVPNTGLLTDTGITADQCYQAGSDVLVSCNSVGALALNDKQDGMIGRDVSSADDSDGKLGFSYSTVGSYPITECVKDNITGLTWEGKTATGTRVGSNTYTNYDSTSQAQIWNGTSYDVPTQSQIDAASNSIGYKNAVNASALCGYTDWRLPTRDELQSLVDYSVAYPEPTIDTTWFPNTPVAIWYWSASPYAGYAAFAWFVSFDYGFVDYVNRDYGGGQVRLVR